ncbi:head-tail connector protein [Brucella sp. RRSP16]|uniref:head-tail connector protein n=1 Tax=Brucella sp. RRSP16 TaxID=3453707 RepID=UPI000EFB8CC2
MSLPSGRALNVAVDLDRLKRHLRIQFDDEDAELEGYLSAAQGSALRYMNRDTVPTGAEAEVDAAVLLIAGDLYENRERQSTAELFENRSARWLLDPYRLLRV